MQHYGYWLMVGLLCWSAVVPAQEQKEIDYVQEATAYLQVKTGKAPQPQEIVDTLNRAVVGLLKKGDYRTCETVAEQTYQFAEQKLGLEHPNTLISINNLAALYRAQGRYGEAEPLRRRVLAGFEKVLGPEHPQTLISIDNLALLYAAQGRYGEAERKYRELLSRDERNVNLLNNLAAVQMDQDKVADAEATSSWWTAW